MRNRILSLWVLAAVSVTALLLPSAAGANVFGEPPAGMTAAEALRYGEVMYRQGLLPSGEPMEAIVQGDIVVDGTMFSCESCHLRSGVGSVEGTIITLPTNATELFKPFTKAAEEALPPWPNVPAQIRTVIRRPAYTEETLARVLWTGEDPSGRVLDPVMPRYDLDERDMAIMVFYLRNLAAEFSPGVSERTIRFATVIEKDVDPARHEAMLKTLRAHIDARNAQPRRQEERAAKGVFYHKKVTTAYRQLELDVWEVSGPPASWEEQLAAYYSQAPVFGLLGGMVDGSWQPVHDFCEKRRIPALFPLTRFPVTGEPGWYTLYFDKGWYQQGEAVARFLLRVGHEPPAPGAVVQIFRDEPAGRALARGFTETWQHLDGPPFRERPVAPGEPVGEKFWRALAAEHPGASFVVWLPRDEATSLAGLAAEGRGPREVVFSADLLGDDLRRLPEALRPISYIAYPHRLPQEVGKTREITESWLRIRKIPLTDRDLQERVYFLGWFLTSALNHMRSDYYRDYFFDGIDMMNDEVYAIASYPRLSFGPGQRYASKGCYMVQVGPGDDPDLVPVTPWVIH